MEGNWGRTQELFQKWLFLKTAVKQVSQNCESPQLSHAHFLVAVDDQVFLFLHAAMSNAVVRTVLLWRMAFPSPAWTHLPIGQFIKSFFNPFSQNTGMAGCMIHVMWNLPSVVLRGEKREQGPSLPTHDRQHLSGAGRKCQSYPGWHYPLCTQGLRQEPWGS